MSKLHNILDKKKDIHERSEALKEEESAMREEYSRHKKKITKAIEGYMGHVSEQRHIFPPEEVSAYMRHSLRKKSIMIEVECLDADCKRETAFELEYYYDQPWQEINMIEDRGSDKLITPLEKDVEFIIKLLKK